MITSLTTRMALLLALMASLGYCVSVLVVWAMPLPTIPATTTDAFREYMEEAGDEEILSILDRFSGMPSGEGFPASENDVLAWKRAGVAIKLGDAADFTNTIPTHRRVAGLSIPKAQKGLIPATTMW